MVTWLFSSDTTMLAAFPVSAVRSAALLVTVPVTISLAVSARATKLFCMGPIMPPCWFMGDMAPPPVKGAARAPAGETIRAPATRDRLSTVVRAIFLKLRFMGYSSFNLFIGIKKNCSSEHATCYPPHPHRRQALFSCSFLLCVSGVFPFDSAYYPCEHLRFIEENNYFSGVFPLPLFCSFIYILRMHRKKAVSIRQNS